MIVIRSNHRLLWLQVIKSSCYRNSGLFSRSLSSNSHILSSPYTSEHLDDYKGDLSLPEFVMKDYLKENIKLRTAYLDGLTKDSITFEELHEKTYKFAYFLKTNGVKSGDCVAIVSPNHIHYNTLFHGISLSGAHSTTINPHYTESEIEYQLQITEPKMIFIHPTVLDKVIQAIKSLPKQPIIFTLSPTSTLSNIHSFYDIINNSTHPNIDYNAFKVDPNSIVTIPFSSGTTGCSKGVVLTHKNLISNCLQIEEIEFQYIRKRPHGGNILNPLPLFHIFGMLFSLCGYPRVGGTVILLPSFDLQKYLELIQEYKVIRGQVVPPIVLALLKHPLVSQYDTSSLESLLSGAAPLGAELQQACAARLKCVVKQAWGMTELSPGGAGCTDADVRPGSSGRLLPGTSAKLVDPITHEVLPPTQEGELLIRGPQVMSGYYQNTDATSGAFTDDGFMYTGDIARFDKDGYLYITDRSKELIKYKGSQVPPAELEAIISTMDSVADCVVIPVLDEESGELPRAYVVKRKDAEVTEQEIIDYVSARVSPTKRLRGGVRFTDTIPKSPSGKLLRRVQVALDRKMSAKNEG